MNIEIDLSNISDVMNSKALDALKCQTRFVVCYGGGGSGKSFGIVQVLLIRVMAEQGHRILVVRKVGRTIRNSVFQTFKDLIYHWNLQELFTIRESDFRITCKNGNEIIFTGVDDSEKLKSISGITSIWIEEATELLQRDFEQLNLRLRGHTKHKKQIYLTFNPVSSSSWLKSRFFNSLDMPDITRIHSTYLDNKFIDEEYKQELEKLIEIDKNLHDIYVLGKWGELKGLIYPEYEVVDKLPDEYEHRRYGLDFGFSNPMALIEVRFIGKEVYIQELYYEVEQTTQQLIEYMSTNGINKNDEIRCDAAEPDRIQTIKEAGFKAVAAKKNINSGIDVVKSYKLHITEDSVNLLREIQSYKWAVDRNGNTLDVPTKMNDHILDALRYAVFIDIEKIAVSIVTKKTRSTIFRGFDDGFSSSEGRKKFGKFHGF